LEIQIVSSPIKNLVKRIAKRNRPLRIWVNEVAGVGVVPFPVVIDKPKGSRVLVLSPHPDDDVLGCGGTLYKHRLAGNEVTVVYLTDGRKGSPGPTDEDSLVVERRKEAEAAAKVIGIKKLVFLDNRDTKLKRSTETVRQMSELLEETQPDIVYLPFFLDNHKDHLAANEIFVASCEAGGYRSQCYAYEVWTAIVPNCLVDISECFAAKLEAIRQHKTQANLDFVAKIGGLNAYRSMAAPDTKYAEAFYTCAAKDYVRLFRLNS
jgi:LmbE family N-acetylglucosaminyl deacetylase